jgi:hypothetical protein
VNPDAFEDKGRPPLGTGGAVGQPSCSLSASCRAFLNAAGVPPGMEERCGLEEADRPRVPTGGARER